MFVETWADMAAALAQFAVPASREFAKALCKMAVQPTMTEMFDAHPAPAG